MIEQPLADRGIDRNITEELDVPYDFLVQFVVTVLFAVEQQEGIDEQRQVVDQRDVEGAIGFQNRRRDLEEIGEVDAATVHRQLTTA